MFTLTNLTRLAVLVATIGICVLYFYAPIFWTDGDWFDAWGGFDAAVGRQLLLVIFIPGFVTSVFLHFSELVWKRLIGLTATALLQVGWLWNLGACWIGGNTLIANRPWADGEHGWDYLCVVGAVLCLAGAVWVARADWRSSHWRMNAYGYKPLPGAPTGKHGARYDAYRQKVTDAQPPERIKL